MSSEQRLKVWRALSDLFLDTEIDDVTFRYIARTISESEFSLSEVESILWYEVYPVLESNLRSVAGVWDGWSDSWLLQNLPASVRPNAIHGDASIIKEIKRCWQKVVEFYASENA
ncbi:hypothetical protein ACDI10_11150 [Vreelandella venusta]|uniref:DUF7079 family protein n=1 Tax=Vreelandella venusta TaxID=44935 RepID=UPI0035563C22